MKSLKAAARRGAVISVTAAAALALAACSGGQITQTDTQVAPVDGQAAATTDSLVAVRDVVIQVEPTNGEASLKFTAINQGYKDEEITLQSIDVDGQQVQLGAVQPMGREGKIVGNSQAELDAHQKQENSPEIQYVATSLNDDDYGYAGYRPVTFKFNTGEITLNAVISAPQMESGTYNRDVQSEEGYTTEAPSAGHGHEH